MPLKRLLAVSMLSLLLAGAATERELDHLTAYARLLSLVRFFHPSDAVAKADWNQVAVAGVKAIEGAENPESFARSLEIFFRPLAPTLRVLPNGAQWEMPPELRHRPAGIVAWRHHGGDFGADKKIYSSERIYDRSPPGFGMLTQAIPAGPLRGRRVRLSAWVRAEVEGDGRVELGLRVYGPDGKPRFFNNMADRPIRDSPWQRVEIEGEVAPDADHIVVLLALTGGGTAWLDEVSLAPALLNASFDEGKSGAQPPGWLFPYESIRAGYHLSTERGEACRRGGCARVVSDPIATPRFVRPEEVLQVDLGAGVTAFLPVALYTDTQSPAAVLPTSDASGDSREARLAAAALAWGILQHFHPEGQPGDPRPALAAAYEDSESFLRAMERLLVPLTDTVARFFRMDEPMPLALPLAWEWIEGRLTITGAAEGTGIKPGDVVLSLDGRPTEEKIHEEEALVSAPTPEGRRWWTLERLLYGPSGSRVTLRLEQAGEVTLTRDTPYERLVAGTPLPPVAEPRPGIFYVDLGRIEEEGFEPLLPRLTSARGVVFDLRTGSNVSNVVLPHLTERTVSSPQWQVPVVMKPDRRDVEWVTTFWTIPPKKPRIRRAAFLIDGRAYGFSETLLGMIEEHRLGEIVGARSGGSNGSVNWTDLPGGYRLRWTGQRVLKHDGSPLHGIGISPTVPAARTLKGIASGRDEIVEKAIESL
ncbi:MAG TPA: S41 family peptidase [Thermoanaerobaculia bacterium]|nr:S41 family peptidase [Thermoanaerobaculia bacterium]